MTKVWVEIDEDRKPLRVFKNHKAMILAMPYMEDGYTTQMERKEAVGAIRTKIWSRQNGICVRCPSMISKAGMHMHERVHRGRGGEVSLENSEGLCYECHLGARGVHPEKQLNFKSRKDKV